MITDWTIKESKFDFRQEQSLASRTDRLLWAGPISCYMGLFQSDLVFVS